MVDVLFIAELAWCVVWLGSRPPLRALLCATGILAATVTAYQCAGWVTNFLSPPSSTVFLWVESQVQDSVQSVMYLNSFLPPQSASVMTSAGLHQWIAHSILKSLVLLLMTGAIFWLFITMVKLMEVLWDVPSLRLGGRQYFAQSALFGVCAGFFTIGLTGYGIVHLAWLKPFFGLSVLGAHSFGIHGLELVMNWMRIHNPRTLL